MAGLLEIVKVAVSGILKPVVDLIDNMHTSEAEKLLLKAQVLMAQQDFEVKLYEAETARLESQHAVQIAEQDRGNAVSRSWRPIVGLSFALQMFLVYGLPVLRGQTVTVVMPDQYWYTMMAIVGVAIAGRSVEKVAQSQANAKGGSQ